MDVVEVAVKSSVSDVQVLPGAVGSTLLNVVVTGPAVTLTPTGLIDGAAKSPLVIRLVPVAPLPVCTTATLSSPI